MRNKAGKLTTPLLNHVGQIGVWWEFGEPVGKDHTGSESMGREEIPCGLPGL